MMLDNLPSNYVQWHEEEEDDHDDEDDNDDVHYNEENESSSSSSDFKMFSMESRRRRLCGNLREVVEHLSGRSYGARNVLSRIQSICNKIRSSVYTAPYWFRSRIQGASALTRQQVRKEMLNARSRADRIIRKVLNSSSKSSHSISNNRHISFQIANSTFSHVFCCAQCSSTLFGKHQVSRHRNNRVQVNLEDSRETISVRRTVTGTIKESQTFRKHRVLNGMYRMKIMFCSSCGVFVGVKVHDFVPTFGRADREEEEEEAFENMNFRSRMSRYGT